MIPEMLLLKGLWEFNRKLWYRSFPFHFGLYILIGAAILSGLGAIFWQLCHRGDTVYGRSLLLPGAGYSDDSRWRCIVLAQAHRPGVA